MCYNCKHDVYFNGKYKCNIDRKRPCGDICIQYEPRKILILPIGLRGNVYK